MKPEQILFPDGPPIKKIPFCDHYAGNERFILKALKLQNELGPIFEVTCDLEDGATIGKEAELRKSVCELLLSPENQHRACGIRVHDVGSPHFREDLTAAITTAGHSIRYVTVPKIKDAAEATQVLKLVAELSREAKLPTPVPVHFLVETPKAIHEVWEIAALPGVRGLDFGIMDYVSFHQGALPSGCMHSPMQFEHPLMIRAKTALSSAALAHGVVPVHNVTTNYQDSTQVFDDALRARIHFGFLRMWSVHPNQIKPIIEAFTPSPGEVTLAREILDAAKQAQWGPITVNGVLHDRASYRYYWGILRAAGSE